MAKQSNRLPIHRPETAVLQHPVILDVERLQRLGVDMTASRKNAFSTSRPGTFIKKPRAPTGAPATAAAPAAGQRTAQARHNGERAKLCKRLTWTEVVFPENNRTEPPMSPARHNKVAVRRGERGPEAALIDQRVEAGKAPFVECTICGKLFGKAGFQIHQRHCSPVRKTPF